MSVLDSLWGVRCVWLRYFDVFRKSIRYYLVTSFTEPVLYLLSFGLGVGALVGTMNVNGVPVSYRSFVFAGIIGQTGPSQCSRKNIQCAFWSRDGCTSGTLSGATCRAVVSADICATSGSHRVVFARSSNCSTNDPGC